MKQDPQTPGPGIIADSVTGIGNWTHKHRDLESLQNPVQVHETRPINTRTWNHCRILYRYRKQDPQTPGPGIIAESCAGT